MTILFYTVCQLFSGYKKYYKKVIQLCRWVISLESSAVEDSTVNSSLESP
jgi:hypothetical protein